MASQIIDEDRVVTINDKSPADGDYTLYWMQQSQRAECNHALEFAIQRANSNSNRLLVAFALTDEYPDANLRHYHFMLEGLQETQSALRRRKIPLIVRKGDPPKVINRLARDASEVICDRGYLRHQRDWRTALAKSCRARVWQVEADAIVPVEKASDKREYAARTIRSKLNGQAEKYLQELATTAIEKQSLNLPVQGLDLSKPAELLDSLSIDKHVKPCGQFAGGTREAKLRSKQFIKHHLSDYGARRSIVEPSASFLSPYLHFGQISPVAVAQEVQSSRGHDRESKAAYLEELLVRRELAINFVYYESDYDNLHCLPDWAAETLDKHESDEREHHYTAAELEEAATHDPAWNAAMVEMKKRGYLHNHLRMYWGKKIIEWTNTTKHAFRTALQLNNRYFLDGRDANSFTNILWLFGLHDRAHQERDIFGKVRFMSFDGLKRKFDVDAYVQRVAREHHVAIQGASQAD